MPKLLTIIVILFSATLSHAQQRDSVEVRKGHRDRRKALMNAVARQFEEEGVIKYKKQWVGGFKLTNDGYGGFLEYGKYKTPRKSYLFQLDIAERKHLKEEKLEADVAGIQPFIYGKVNFFYPVKLGFQYQYLIGNKGNTNGVNVTVNAGGGAVLGLLRPYEYKFTDDGYFLGGPGISDGWNRMKMTPGLFAKAGARFDYGKFREVVTGLEIGGSVEYYAQTIPQMEYIKEQRIFTGFYVALIFGKRK